MRSSPSRPDVNLTRGASLLEHDRQFMHLLFASCSVSDPVRFQNDVTTNKPLTHSPAPEKPLGCETAAQYKAGVLLARLDRARLNNDTVNQVYPDLQLRPATLSAWHKLKSTSKGTSL